MITQTETMIPGGNSAGGYLPPPNYPLAPSADAPMPQFPILRAPEHSLVFSVAPLEQHQALVRRLKADSYHCVYVLMGELNDRPVARGGKTEKPLARLGTHLGTPELRHLTNVAVIAGPKNKFNEKDLAALECLVLRQIAAVGAVNPGSNGPEMLKFEPVVWNKALDAFLFLRWGLKRARISFLEPLLPQHPASLIATAIGIRERWAPNAFETRKTLVAEGGEVRGEKLDFDHGDYITIAEKRGDAYWLLAGSEIRATAFASARPKDRDARSELLSSGHAAHVRGFPDRIELLVDRKVGFSEDRLTKFVMGTAGCPNHWRPFVRKPIDAPDAAPTLAI